MQDHKYSVPDLVNHVENLVRTHAANIFIYRKMIKQIYLESIPLRKQFNAFLGFISDFLQSSPTVPTAVSLTLPVPI